MSAPWNPSNGNRWITGCLLVSLSFVLDGCGATLRSNSSSLPASGLNGQEKKALQRRHLVDGSYSWEQEMGAQFGPFFLGGFCAHTAASNLLSMHYEAEISPQTFVDETRTSPLGLSPETLVKLLNRHTARPPGDSTEWNLVELQNEANPLDSLKKMLIDGPSTGGRYMAVGPTRLSTNAPRAKRFPVAVLVAFDPRSFQTPPSSDPGLAGQFQRFYRDHIDKHIPYKFYLHYPTVIDITEDPADGCMVHSNSWGNQQQTPCQTFLRQWSMEILHENFTIESNVLGALNLKNKRFVIVRK